MRRDQLEHIIRAAADVADDHEIVVVGSQAILAEHPDAPPSLLISREADLYPRNHPERATAIDANIGEGSYFDDSFDCYARGGGPETAKAPNGWEERLVPLRNENTGGATGWCLESHDVVLAKCVAGRERDWEFAEEALRHGIVDPGELLRRVPRLPLPAEQREAVHAGLVGLIGRVAT